MYCFFDTGCGCQDYMLSWLIQFLKCILFKSHVLKWFSVRTTSNENHIPGLNVIQVILVLSGCFYMYKRMEMKRFLKNYSS